MFFRGIKIKTKKIKRIYTIQLVFVFLGVFFVFFPSSVQAAFTEKINYQGKLLDENGVVVPDGNYDISFRLYTVGGGGSAIWTEEWTSSDLWTDSGTKTVNRNDSDCGGSGFTKIEYNSNTNESTLGSGQYLWNTNLKESAVIISVSTSTNTICIANPYSSWATAHNVTNRIFVKNGIFSVMLGGVSSLSSIDFNQTLYLGVTISPDTNEMIPRKVIGAVPAAFESKKLQGYDWASPSDIGTVTAAAGNFTNLTASEGLSVGATYSSILAPASGVIVEGNVGIGVVSPSAYLNIKGGTSEAGNAPLKFTSGTNLTVVEAGTMEYDGINLYFTPSITRKTIAFSEDISAAYVSYTGATGNLNLGSHDIIAKNLNISGLTDFAGSVAIKNSIDSGALTDGLLIENTGTGTITNAISILETAGSVTTGINIGNNVETGIAIGTGVTRGISVGSGGITIESGDLAVNSDSITSDGTTLTINANGTVDVDDILNSDSITTDTGGVTIANSQSYSGSGEVTLSSAIASALTINSGTTGTINIGNDSSAEIINIGTGEANKTLVIGSLNSASGVTIQSGTGNIALQPAGSGATGIVQIGAGSGTNTAPDLLSLDTKSDAGDPAGTAGDMYYNINAGKFRCFQGSAWTNCISSLETAAGGSTTQIQYNNAGSFAGAANANIENDYLRLSVASTPSSVAEGGLDLYARSVGGRIMPVFMGPSGLDATVQPSIGRNKVALWQANGAGDTTTTALGAVSISITGTATAANMATTTRQTTMRRVEFLQTQARSTNVVGFRSAAAAYARGGPNSGDGGFHMIANWGPATGVATATNRAFVGMANSTVAPTDVNPSTLTNMMGFGWDSTDTNIQFMTNDSSGTATKIDLGASFPVPTANRTKMYETIIFVAPGPSTSIGYKITDLATGAIAEGTVSSDLVANTTYLAPRGYMSVGGTSSVIGIAFSNLYVETDY